MSPNATCASYGVRSGDAYASPQSRESRGQATWTQAPTSWKRARRSGEISETNSVRCGMPRRSSSRSTSSSTPGLPCRPSVPRIRPTMLAPFAASIAALRMLCIWPCANPSRVSLNSPGSYRKKPSRTCGFWIMALSRWKRPSHTKTTASTSPTCGDVQPSVSPMPSGFTCGVETCFGSAKNSRRNCSAASAMPVLNCTLPMIAIFFCGEKLWRTVSTRCSTSTWTSTCT
mmetsp:Transcript_50321/g.101305  ORF Transcript_50321/g.101305 Transcript_50321/m.101305 type:complete len:230 (+) Transcript_50321:123-812(+)